MAYIMTLASGVCSVWSLAETVFSGYPGGGIQYDQAPEIPD